MRAALLDRSLDPSNGGQVDPELMLQVPARPDRGGLSVERQPDPPSFQIFRRAHARTRVDENIAVTEYARRKHRKRDERAVARTTEADIFGCRKLGDVELLASDHAVEDIAPGFERDAVEIDALDPDLSVADRFHPVVSAARERQCETGHGGGAPDAAAGR